LIVAVGLTTWLFYNASPGDVLASLSRAAWPGLVAAVLLVVVDRSLMAYRWMLLLRAIATGREVALGAVMRLFFVATFLGTFLPASVGGDAVRTIGLARLQIPPADALASVVVDRILGVVSVLLMAVGGLLVVRHLIDTASLVSLVAVTTAVLVASLLLLFDSRVLSGFLSWLTARRLPAIERMGNRALSAIRQYGHERRALLVVLVASVAVQVLRTLQAWCLGWALGLDVNLAWYFAFIPLIVLFMAAPISIGGLGTSQLAFTALFGSVGVVEADAFALSVLFLALGWVGNLPGGLLVATGGSADRRRATKLTPGPRP